MRMKHSNASTKPCLYCLIHRSADSTINLEVLMLLKERKIKVEEVVVATQVSVGATSPILTMLTLCHLKSSSISCSLVTNLEVAMFAHNNKGNKDRSEVGIKKI